VKAITRARSLHLALVGLSIAVGLLVHFYGADLGSMAQDVIGDALWAAMIAWALGAAAPGARLVVRSAIAYAWCIAVEVSQLYHTPALDAIRATRAGHLALGSGFDARDLVSYALGVAAAAIVSASLRADRAAPARA
jgi:hypothetical protein